jgi:hypothetical protein
MKSYIIWDITPCSPLKVKRRFGRAYRPSPACLLLVRSDFSESQLVVAVKSVLRVSQSEPTSVSLLFPINSEIPANRFLWFPLAFTLVSCLVYSPTLKTEAKCSSESRLTFNGIYGVISQKTELFIHSVCLGKDSDYKVKKKSYLEHLELDGALIVELI